MCVRAGRRGAAVRAIGLEALSACFDDICRMVDAFTQPGEASLTCTCCASASALIDTHRSNLGVCGPAQASHMLYMYVYTDSPTGAALRATAAFDGPHSVLAACCMCACVLECRTV